MPTYQKKPVKITAVQITWANRHELAEWVRGTAPDNTDVIKIPTLEGVMTGHVGDFIIQGVKGEFYSCKKEIFELTYEKVED